MKRNRPSSRKRISADATELGRLAIGLAEAGGQLEEVFWEKQLVELVERLLKDGAEDYFIGFGRRLARTFAYTAQAKRANEKQQ